LTELPEQGDCTEKLALYSEYWNRHHFKLTTDAVQPPDEEPLVGRTSLVEGNYQLEFGGWNRLARLVYRSKNR
jgi:hypothetical protein